MSDIPDDVRLALQIQAEGAENIVRVCTELFDFARAKMSGDSAPSLDQRQQAYRFLAATAGVLIDMYLPAYENIERFSGFSHRVQELNCLHVCRMENFASEIGDALFKVTWEQMFDDVSLASKHLTAAYESGRGGALYRDYPRAYFMSRHQINLLHFDKPTLHWLVSIIALDLQKAIKANLENIEAVYAKDFPR